MSFVISLLRSVALLACATDAHSLDRPEDKPILCNACGARYLVKRSLVGYFPHARPATKKEQEGGHSGRPAAGQAKTAAADGKRKRKAGRECVLPCLLTMMSTPAQTAAVQGDVCGGPFGNAVLQEVPAYDLKLSSKMPWQVSERGCDPRRPGHPDCAARPALPANRTTAGAFNPPRCPAQPVHPVAHEAYQGAHPDLTTSAQGLVPELVMTAPVPKTLRQINGFTVRALAGDQRGGFQQLRRPLPKPATTEA